MTEDHYGDAIRAGAAALAKPYREPETIRAFTDEYPTLAAARVLNAALPHMRAAIIAEGITPGPCRAEEQLPPWASEGRRLHALCDLRAGHAGQHEAEDDQWGHFRWTDDAPVSGCTSRLELDPGSSSKCERTTGHVGLHICAFHAWNDCGERVLPGE